MTPQSLTKAEKRQALIAKLLAKEGVAVEAARIPRREGERGRAPLSFSQEQLWLWYQLEPENPAYAMLFCFRLQGAVDVAAMEKSFAELICRHEVLRTTFETVMGEPVQAIQPPPPVSIPVVDLTAISQEQQEAEVQRLAQEEARHPFNLTETPLLRVRLLRLSATEYRGVLLVHHIAYDGWSVEVLTREIAALYTAFVRGEPSPLPELPIQYGDFAVWQREKLQGDSLNELVAYWQDQLAGIPEGLDLPFKQPRPPVQSYRGATEYFTLTPLLASLEALSRSEGASLFMTLLAAFNVLLYRYTGQDDLVVGSPIANRGRRETAGLIGFLINTLAIRSDLSGNPTFRELLSRVGKAAAGAYAHQDLPFEMLVDKLQLKRDLSRSPVFQVMFVLQTTSEAALELPGVTLNVMDMDQQVARYDLTMSLFKLPDALKGQFAYNTDLFDPDLIRRMLAHFQVLLEGIVADPDRRIASLPLLPDAELQTLLVAWNDTHVACPQDQCVHHLFEAQVQRAPEAPAVVYGDQVLSYRDLNRRANQLAHHLRGLGVGPEVLVGVCMERSPELLVGLLGVLKAGGAYVPLDVMYPRERLAFMLQDSGAAVVLTQTRWEGLLPEGSRLIRLDADWEAIVQESPENPQVGVAQENLAYMIYTSGSTGRPKGAAILHRGLANYLHWCERAYPLAAGCGAPVHSSISFDLTVTSIFAPLATGRQVHLLSEDLGIDALLMALRSGAEYSLVKITPVHLNLLAQQLSPEEAAGRTRAFIIGGENLLAESIAFWQKYAPETLLVNEYGPTETVVGCCVYQAPVGKAQSGSVPIGQPISNTQLYALDAHMNPAPVGVAGELYIGGAGLARGYHKKPGLTAEKFVPDPFGVEPGARLYRTGDLARWLPDGNLEFLGRVDHQVKVRGFRIETGEIETALAQHPAVRKAVVLAREDRRGDNRLVAYVAARDGNRPSVAALRSFLQATLPDYMIPTAFVMLDAIPLTANGKVDRRALPAPEEGALDGGGDFVAPRTPIEEVLAGIWGQVLEIERVGVYDHFFELGGHSLLAMQVVSRIRDAFRVELPVRTLFESPTVADLAGGLIEAQRADRGLVIPPLQRASRDGDLPLSFAQRRLWFLNQLEPESAAYNIPAAVRLSGNLDVTALERSLNEIVRRHEALRTRIGMAEGRPIQLIAADLKVSLPLVNLDDTPEAEQSAVVRRLAEEEARALFDLAGGPLLRARLLRLGETEHVLLLTVHHIVSDGWSVGVLIREAAALYAAFVKEESAPLAELPVQYADFAIWQQGWLRDAVLAEQLAYWQEQLGGTLPALELPTSRPRPAIQSYRGAMYSFELPAALTPALHDLNRREGMTAFMTLLAAFKVWLYRYTGQEDVIVGSPVAGRNYVEIEALIGFFVNTLVLRTDLSGEPTFYELLRRVREAALGATMHQDVPFEMLVDVLQPERSLSRSPLFQVMFVLQNIPMGAMALPGLDLIPLPVDNGTTHFDLTLYLSETAEGLAGTFEYSTDLFDAALIARMAGHFQVLLENIVADPGRRISEFPLMTEAETRQVVQLWNATAVAYPRDRCIHELFEDQVSRTPDAVAVRFEGEGLTYRELNRRANQAARHLVSLGVGPEVLVGICMERSLEMVIGLYAILKAGGAYVPLDPTYPAERLAFMLADAQVGVLLIQERLREKLGGSTAQTIALDADWTMIARQADGNFDSGVEDANLAYVIYTSGSTGNPKGAMNTHGAIRNRLQWMSEIYRPGTSDRVMQKTPFSFDVSVWEFFWPLLNGACLVAARPEGHKDSRYLADLIAEEDITVLHFVPSMLRLFIEEPAIERCGSLKHVICSGEALPYDLQERFFEQFEAWGHPSIQLHNLYGPTEAAVDVTWWRCESGDARRIVPIGYPIANTQLYVLDRRLSPAPVGVTGGLYIGGEALARGYHRRAGLTAEKFIPNPFSAAPGARLYWTGDLARYLPDGAIDYVGRCDDQVKLRGFRIELGEIEAALARHSAVQESVVLAREDVPGDKRLAAYVQGRAGCEVVASDLRLFLAQTLPDYMIPSVFVILDEIPLTPNGKVNRQALPAPQDASGAGGEDYVAPRTSVEKTLADIFANVLNVKRVGARDNFFSSGGHSLAAIQLISRVREDFQIDIPLRASFEAPTVDELARYIEIVRRQGAAATDITPVPREGALPLSFAQQWLWALEQKHAGDQKLPARGILSGIKRFLRLARRDVVRVVNNLVFVVRLDGALDRPVLERSLDELAHRHEILRSMFPITEGQRSPCVALGAPPPPLLVESMRDCPEAAREARVRERIEREFAQLFDLAHGPLWRVSLLEMSAVDHVLLLGLHPLIGDEESAGVFVREIAALYAGFTGEDEPLPAALPAQYIDFAAWQRASLPEAAFQAQIVYWEQRLTGSLPMFRLPPGKSRAALPASRCVTQHFSLPPATTAIAAQLSAQHGATLSTTLLTVFEILLHHYTGQNDILVVMPFANRERSEVQGMIGRFGNKLALRTPVLAQTEFGAVLSYVHQTIQEARQYPDLPFAVLLDNWGLGHWDAGLSLFQVLFEYGQDSETARRLPGLTLSLLPVDQRESGFDLALRFKDTESALTGSLDYTPGLFTAEDIAGMVHDFQRLFEYVCGDLLRWKMPVEAVVMSGLNQSHPMEVV